MTIAMVRPGAIRMLSRGLRRRCPQCGGGSLFASCFRIRARCPTCGIRTERGEDPFSKTLFLTFDLLFRPAHDE